MARGKLKYRDVVGGKSKKNTKKPKKPRKTYSLFQQNSKKERKRKPEFKEEVQKRPKIEQKSPKVDTESENEESEEEDVLKQLRNTFTDPIKSQEAIESSDDSSEEQNNDLEDREELLEEQIEENENEEEEECEIDLDTQKEEEDLDNEKDLFVQRLFYDLDENLLDSLKNSPTLVNNHSLDWPYLGKMTVQIPHFEPVKEEKLSGIMEVKKYAPQGKVPKKIELKAMRLEDLSIKKQIIENLAKTYEDLKIFSPFQAELFSILNNYQDLLYSSRTFDNSEEIRFVYCLHAINHILKTRIKILHHNARLTKKNDVPEEFRDQGLVRPKILIVLPFKDAAFKTVNMLIDILLEGDKGNVMNKKRFIEEYTGNEIVMPKKNPKPEDFEMTFAGNTGDDFRIGLTITKKSIKLYANFYSADIIIASPLGLRTIIGAEGEPERDYDFLASVELLIVDQSELFLMQNWDHLLHLFSHLHLQPKNSHGTDFSRVRTWSLNGWSKFYRQTILVSSICLPEINAIFNKRCFNYWGKVKVCKFIEFGSICQVFVQLPHVFHKFNSDNILKNSEDRFLFFTNKILPLQKDVLMKQTLIFVSNYFDYVKLRNYFKREDIGFVQICEYSKEAKVARARDMFFHGDAHFLLYTERYHFFNRIRIKGIRHLVFYQIPNFSHFYYEMCNLMQESNMNKKVGSQSNMSVTVLYSKYDIHQLAAIVGTEKASKMLHSDRNVHMIMTKSN